MPKATNGIKMMTNKRASNELRNVLLFFFNCRLPPEALVVPPPAVEPSGVVGELLFPAT